MSDDIQRARGAVELWAREYRERLIMRDSPIAEAELVTRVLDWLDAIDRAPLFQAGRADASAELEAVRAERDQAKRVASEYIAATDPVLDKMEALSNENAALRSDRDRLAERLARCEAVPTGGLWSSFLGARYLLIVKFRNDGYSWEQVAATLSCDAEQVERIHRLTPPETLAPAERSEPQTPCPDCSGRPTPPGPVVG